MHTVRHITRKASGVVTHEAYVCECGSVLWQPEPDDQIVELDADTLAIDVSRILVPVAQA